MSSLYSRTESIVDIEPWQLDGHEGEWKQVPSCKCGSESIIPRFATNHQSLKRDKTAVTDSLNWNPVQQVPMSSDLRMCVWPIVTQNQPNKADRLGPKGRGYWGGQQSFAWPTAQAQTNPVDSIALKVQTNDHQERSNPSMLLLSEKVLTGCIEVGGFPKKQKPLGKLWDRQTWGGLSIVVRCK